MNQGASGLWAEKEVDVDSFGEMEGEKAVAGPRDLCVVSMIIFIVVGKFRMRRALRQYSVVWVLSFEPLSAFFLE